MTKMKLLQVTILLVSLSSILGFSNQNVEPNRNLFSFNADGTEASGLLPRLDRQNIIFGSYYEEEDPDVVRLRSRIDVSSVDACWALDACEGNFDRALFYCNIAVRHSRMKDGSYPQDISLEWMLQRRVQQMKKEVSERGLIRRVADRFGLFPKKNDDVQSYKSRWSSTQSNKSRTHSNSILTKIREPKRRFVELFLFLGLCRFMFGPQLLPLLA